jgi:hypothetical protein
MNWQLLKLESDKLSKVDGYGMRSHVVFLLVFSFLQVIGDNVVMVNFVSMALNICLCFLAFNVWRFWVVYVLCYIWWDANYGTMRIFKVTSMSIRRELRKKMESSFSFHVCLVFLGCIEIQENQSKISWWIVGDECACCQRFTTLSFKVIYLCCVMNFR